MYGCYFKRLLKLVACQSVIGKMIDSIWRTLAFLVLFAVFLCSVVAVDRVRHCLTQGEYNVFTFTHFIFFFMLLFMHTWAKEPHRLGELEFWTFANCLLVHKLVLLVALYVTRKWVDTLPRLFFFGYSERNDGRISYFILRKSSYDVSKVATCIIGSTILWRCCSTQPSSQPLRIRKRKSQSKYSLKFVDWRKVKVTGGKGGDGLIAFLRLWCNPNAGPCGGDGGNGGHIIFVADTSTKSLENVHSQYIGKGGEKGGTDDMHGASAEHTIIQVPIGTTVKDENGNVVADLDYHGARFVAARGGAGGKGNHFFLSNENRHPRVAELGAEGETRVYHLELKILAHCGLVGFPSAGKSTLLQAISRARPKIASYPFTTLNPHVGIVHYDDYEQLAVADLPGLIPGAHKNRGLGISFLRHIERCVCLMYVLDLSHESPWEQLNALKYELEQYQTGLSKTPNAIVANKIDIPEAQANLKLLQEKIDVPIFPISARYGVGLTKLLFHLRELYDKNNEKKLIW